MHVTLKIMEECRDDGYKCAKFTTYNYYQTEAASTYTKSTFSIPVLPILPYG